MSTPQFTFDDVVRVMPTAPAEAKPGARAWIVGVYTASNRGQYFDQFGDVVVYTIEFEDGSSTEIRETDLEAWA